MTRKPSIAAENADRGVQIAFGSGLPDADAGSRTGLNATMRDWQFLVLAAVAVLYAGLANLRTVSDSDLFWQLASGRWIWQHHRIFSTDVFSYTAPGQPWIYPIGSEVFFYLAYRIGGYALISWIGAVACAGTVALLLRRGSITSCAVAILAVPVIAERMLPRADMFSVVLFAAYLSILWQYHQTGRARLWLLPILMVAWANLHPGFVAGLGLMGAFLAVELLELPFGTTRRTKARQRLGLLWLWFAVSALATLVNPWGWRVYSSLLRQYQAMAVHSAWIAEWGSLPLNWTAFLSESALRYTRGAFYVLFALGVTIALLAILQRQIGSALLVAGSLYAGAKHVRLDALSACVVVVVGGAVLSSALQHLAPRISTQNRKALATGLAAAFCALALIRTADAVTGYRDHGVSRFGAGLTWWVPQRAADFVQRENLPGEIFNTYNVGGYLVWKLGPERRDYLDGRALPFGEEIFKHQAELLATPLDSEIWRHEADRYHINTILLTLLRYESLGNTLKTFCQSTQWRPVYLDEVSVVFVRRTPATQQLIQRFPVDCATASLPVGPAPRSRDGLFNAWTNAATVLASLGRYPEALTALDHAARIFPDSYFVAGMSGSALYAMDLRSDAEREFRRAVALEPAAYSGWFSLADLYHDEGRLRDSIRAQQRGIDVSVIPQPQARLKLARLYFEAQQPRAALSALDDAMQSAGPDLLSQTGPRSFRYQVALGTASAWRALGDPKRAAMFDEEAVRDLLPKN